MNNNGNSHKDIHLDELNIISSVRNRDQMKVKN